MSESDQPQQWLEQHGDALFAYAWRRVGEREVAEDLVQDTLLAAWKHRAKFRGDSTRRTWLIAILRRKIIDERRKRANMPTLGVLPEAGDWFNSRGRWKTKPASWGNDPVDACEMNDFRRVLAGCIDRLPEDQAAAFKLRAVREVSTQDCCKQLGVTTSNLGVRLYRARMALRRCLELGWFKTGPRSKPTPESKIGRVAPAK
ncbi:MAG: sigma-70 family RNA polymerase sigma factor [Planctomycetota bacterium]